MQNEKVKGFSSCFPKVSGLRVLSMLYAVWKLGAALKLPIKILPFPLLTFSEENKWKKEQVFLDYAKIVGPSG